MNYILNERKLIIRKRRNLYFFSTLFTNKICKESMKIRNFDKVKVKLRYLLDKKERFLNIFGKEFVLHYKKSCKIIIKRKMHEFRSSLLLDKSIIKDGFLKIKLYALENLQDIRYMFSECSNLCSFLDISNLVQNHTKYINSMFASCSSLQTCL